VVGQLSFKFVHPTTSVVVIGFFFTRYPYHILRDSIKMIAARTNIMVMEKAQTP
jgi:hypothetical protein